MHKAKYLKGDGSAVGRKDNLLGHASYAVHLNQQSAFKKKHPSLKPGGYVIDDVYGPVINIEYGNGNIYLIVENMLLPPAMALMNSYPEYKDALEGIKFSRFDTTGTKEIDTTLELEVPRANFTVRPFNVGTKALVEKAAPMPSVGLPAPATFDISRVLKKNGFEHMALIDLLDNDNWKAVDILLKNGLDVNAVILDNGTTMLHYAATNRIPESTTLLIKYGADTSLKNTAGKTALQLAEQELGTDKKDRAGINVAKYEEVIKLLKAKDRTVEDKDKTAGAKKPASLSKDDETKIEQFFQAIEKGDVKAVETLINAGVNVNAEYTIFNNNNNNALGFAIEKSQKNKVEIVKLLISKSINLAYNNSKGYNALHIAAESRDLNVVKALIDTKTFNISEPVASGMKSTALHLAASYGPKEMIEYLVFKGANLQSKDANDRKPSELAQGELKACLESLEKGKGVSVPPGGEFPGDTGSRMPRASSAPTPGIELPSDTSAEKPVDQHIPTTTSTNTKTPEGESVEDLEKKRKIGLGLLVGIGGAATLALAAGLFFALPLASAAVIGITVASVAVGGAAIAGGAIALNNSMNKKISALKAPDEKVKITERGTAVGKTEEKSATVYAEKGKFAEKEAKKEEEKKATSKEHTK